MESGRHRKEQGLAIFLLLMTTRTRGLRRGQLGAEKHLAPEMSSLPI